MPIYRFIQRARTIDHGDELPRVSRSGTPRNGNYPGCSASINSKKKLSVPGISLNCAEEPPTTKSPRRKKSLFGTGGIFASDTPKLPSRSISSAKKQNWKNAFRKRWFSSSIATPLNDVVSGKPNSSRSFISLASPSLLEKVDLVPGEGNDDERRRLSEGNISTSKYFSNKN